MAGASEPYILWAIWRAQSLLPGHRLPSREFSPVTSKQSDASNISLMCSAGKELWTCALAPAVGEGCGGRMGAKQSSPTQGGSASK